MAFSRYDNYDMSNENILNLSLQILYRCYKSTNLVQLQFVIMLEIQLMFRRSSGMDISNVQSKLCLIIKCQTDDEMSAIINCI
jgi:hypothetical protein